MIKKHNRKWEDWNLIKHMREERCNKKKGNKKKRKENKGKVKCNKENDKRE